LKMHQQRNTIKNGSDTNTRSKTKTKTTLERNIYSKK
jgi:hypothetical protein